MECADQGLSFVIRSPNHGHWPLIGGEFAEFGGRPAGRLSRSGGRRGIVGGPYGSDEIGSSPWFC